MKKSELEPQEKVSMHQMLVNFIRCARLGNLTLGEVEDAVRKQFMIDALQEAKGNQQRAAKELGMHRNTIGREIDKFNIDIRGMKKKAASVGGEQKVNRSA